MIENEFYNKFWYNYKNLEDKVIEYERYIEFNEHNYKVYSRELMQLLFVICSEVDTMLNLITNEEGIVKYRDFITTNNDYSNITKEEVSTIIFDELKFKPFEEFDLGNSPVWWIAYNDNKHNRVQPGKYEESNLENILSALAGLYLLEIYYFHISFYDANSAEVFNYNIPKGQSRLFKASILTANYVSVNDLEGILVNE